MAKYTADLAGEHLAVVRGGVVLMLPAASAPVVDDLWARLTEPDPVRTVLDRLTVDGLSSTPSFGLAVRDGDRVRVVVRGAFSVRLGAEAIDGEGVSTWVERVADATALSLGATDASAAPDAVVLPIVEGVVFAASVSSDAVEPVAAPEAAAPSGAPVTAPASIAAAAPAAPPTAPPTAPAAAPAAADPSPSRPVIDPATWAPPANPAAASPPPLPPLPPAPGPGPASGFDAVDDATIIAPVGGSPAAPAAPAAPADREEPAPAAGGEQTIVPPTDTIGGDHDGMTVVGVDLQRLRAERDARRAAQGDLDAPAASAASGAVAAPRLSLRMPDGSLEPVTHEVLLGRAPSVSQVSGGRLPRVVAIGAGDQDISRNHVRVAVEGDTVVITDLHSRNGTHVAQPGKAPVRLRAGEPTPVLVGTVVDLGGGWTIQVVAS